MMVSIKIFLLISNFWVLKANLNSRRFPEDFLFGAATASYQIEGAWNVNGKGENIWDHVTHNRPDLILDRSTGDDACKSYYKVEEDVEILKDLRADFYRFSISWSRILPTGFKDKINPDGIRYYNKLLNLLQANGIKAMATIYHWDLPQPLQELGGWTNTSIVDVYLEYSRILFENFGDRVTTWVTFNEPFQICREGYGSAIKAPAWNNTGISDYQCGYNLLKAHAKAWHLYNNTYRTKQKGKIGIVLNSPWAEPASTNQEDVLAAKRILDFFIGWFAHPIFTKEGDYPEVMKKNVAYRSALEGYEKSRLPEFTRDEIESLKGTSDFFGVNHYTSVIGRALSVEAAIGSPNFVHDLNIGYNYDSSWPSSASPWLKVVPWGFKKLLQYVKDEYGNPEIYITENGYPDDGAINDPERISYFQEYLSSVLDAIDAGVSIKLYTVWSLLDNFEWFEGYTSKFGIVQIDFKSENKTRTYKKSVDYIKHVFKNKMVTGYKSNSVNNIANRLNVFINLFIITSIYIF